MTGGRCIATPAFDAGARLAVRRFVGALHLRYRHCRTAFLARMVPASLTASKKVLNF